MANKKVDVDRDYVWPHPRYKKATDKKWLEGRSKFPTGFCTARNPLSAQGHEGTTPVQADGTPMKICTFYETCPCTCHKEIDDMYATIGEPRPLPEQSTEYEAMAAARHAETAAMLDGLTRSTPFLAPLLDASDPMGHPDDERPVAGAQGVSAGTGFPVFHATPTGIRARGQLEHEVLRICRDYSNGVYDWSACTPKLVAEEIGKSTATEPPSTGAINAVWDRWEKMEFATQDKKPSRFVKFLKDGEISTLEGMKLRAKRAKKLSTAEAKRGSLRPRGR